MKIGINVTAAFKKTRTGVEEYVFRLVEALTRLPEAKQYEFLLYKDRRDQGALGFDLPRNFKIKELSFPIAWTQTRLALEMLVNRPEVLFIPVHILPRFHPANSVVTIHGLEYEYFPEYYPRNFVNYIRSATKYALKQARRIIVVSETTKNDLLKLYGADPQKITVIHHGFSTSKLGIENQNKVRSLAPGAQKPYLLYLGRIELKKNIPGILDAYKILKEKYQIPHALVLAGSSGYGYDKIKSKIKDLKLEIDQPGFVSEEKKWQLLKSADAFLFPSLYEGFGLPILEAQSVGVPVITSDVSSMPEVAGEGAILVNPQNPEEIAAGIYEAITETEKKKLLIERGFDNLKRFDWKKCAKETLGVLID